jgi:serralysin
VIHDFSQAECDRLDVSQIDANTRISGDQTFKFIGENANFNGSAGELRFQHVNGDTIVYGDVNGDRVADFSFALNDDIVLRASDFVL